MRQTSLSQYTTKEVDTNDEAKSDIESVARKVMLSRQRLGPLLRSEDEVKKYAYKII